MGIEAEEQIILDAIKAEKEDKDEIKRLAKEREARIREEKELEKKNAIAELENERMKRDAERREASKLAAPSKLIRFNLLMCSFNW